MSRRLVQTALIFSMAAGSLLMWTAVPALWLWIGGRFSRVSQSDMTSIAIVLTGIPANMIAVGHGLSRLDQRYTANFGPPTQQRRAAGARWLHSLRGGRDEEPVTMLDKIMVFNVAGAILTVAVWLFFFSQGSQAPRTY